jgi:hypothetical protein
VHLSAVNHFSGIDECTSNRVSRVSGVTPQWRYWAAPSASRLLAAGSDAHRLLLAAILTEERINFFASSLAIAVILTFFNLQLTQLLLAHALSASEVPTVRKVWN